jgi:hypothetical protein
VPSLAKYSQNIPLGRKPLRWGGQLPTKPPPLTKPPHITLTLTLSLDLTLVCWSALTLLITALIFFGFKVVAADAGGSLRLHFSAAVLD